MSLFLYRLKCFDDLDNKIIETQGIIWGNTYAKAMANLESYYGDDIVEILYLFALEEDIPLELSTATYEVVKIESNK